MSNENDNDVMSGFDSIIAPEPEPVEEQAPVQEAPQASSVQADDSVELPDLDFAERSNDPQIKVVPDAKTLAVKFGIIGTGQGGGRLADTFYQMGYRRVCAINTNEQDFLGLNLPDSSRLVMPSEGGAGKQPSKGGDALIEATEDVINLMRRTFGDDVDRIIVCSGAGGGTGTGSTTGLLKLAKNYMQQMGKEPKVGLIMSIPKFSEGGTVQKNAYDLVERLQPMIEKKEISPVVITDNQAIHQMFPNISAKAFWSTANKNTVGLFDIFNVLAAQRSQYTTFDKADYENMLDSGLIIFGATKLQSYQRETDISDGLRKNLKRSLLADGFELTKATHAAGILAAPDAIMEVLPQSHIDLAFETLERVMNGQNRSFTLHQGVYEASNMGLFLYTMVGGLTLPQKRLDIMKAKAGLDDN